MQHNILLISRPCAVLVRAIVKPLSSCLQGHKTVLVNSYEIIKSEETAITVETTMIGDRMPQLAWVSIKRQFFCELAVSDDVLRQLPIAYLTGLHVHTQIQAEGLIQQ
jgi:hypothetical protein